MTFALIFFLAIFSVLAWRRLDLAGLIIIAALPSYLIRFSVLGLPLTLLEAMILLTALAWTLKHFWPENRKWLKAGWQNWRSGTRLRAAFKLPLERQNYPWATEIILVLIISFLAAGSSGFSPSALGIWKAYFFEPILLFILIINIFPDRRHLPKIFGALSLSLVVISLLAIWQKISGQFIANPFWAEAATRRVVSVFGYPNAVGLYLAPIIMISGGWLAGLDIKKNWRMMAALAAGLIMSVLAVYFARSDGAMIALALSLILSALILGQKKMKLIVGLIFLIGLGAMFSLAPTDGALMKKLSFRDLSGEIRQQQWQETWTMLADNRWLSGSGLNNYQTAIAPYHQDGIFFNFDNRPNFDAVVWASSTLQQIYWQPVEIYLYPHNIFLNFWTELGLLGALLFIWIIGKFIWQTGRRSLTAPAGDKAGRYWSWGLMAAMLTVLIHGLVDVPYFKNDLAALFWIMLAIGAIIQINQAQNPAETDDKK